MKGGNTAVAGEPLSRRDLRDRVLASLRDQGFEFGSDGLLGPLGPGKERIRDLHLQALRARVERAKEGLSRHEDRLLAYIANGSEVEPAQLRPVVKEVEPHSEEELLFRYARLHWSIPVSAGYGRRLRFLILDDHTGKLIGLFGLGDPVFALGPRDSWIGWNRVDRKERLRYVMDAFVLGAVQPYSQLLCGKLVAMMMASTEVVEAFSRKYKGNRSLISEHTSDGRLALLTTTSALGRSSLYNRLRLGERKLFISAGFTLGSGEFHFSNGVYEDLLAFARAHHAPSAKHDDWGNGWRSRREVVRKVLPELGLSRDLLYHRVKREVFVVPLADNARQFLHGEHQRLRRRQPSIDEAFAWFRERWLLPRAAWDVRYRDFVSDSYRIWPRNGEATWPKP